MAEFGSGGTAFLSTPSIFFSLAKDLRAKCKVFDVRPEYTGGSHKKRDYSSSSTRILLNGGFVTTHVRAFIADITTTWNGDKQYE